MIIHCWICNCEIENITQIGPLEKAWGQKLFDQLTHPQYFGFLVNFNPHYARVLKSPEGLRYPPLLDGELYLAAEWGIIIEN